MIDGTKTILGALALLALVQCASGYVKAEALNKKELGPEHCAARCRELGMEMGALVLVSDQLPGCVCQPKAGATATSDGGVASTSQEGAAGATTGYAVGLAAAAAAHQQQTQSQSKHP